MYNVGEKTPNISQILTEIPQFWQKTSEILRVRSAPYNLILQNLWNDRLGYELLTFHKVGRITADEIIASMK